LLILLEYKTFKPLSSLRKLRFEVLLIFLMVLKKEDNTFKLLSSLRKLRFEGFLVFSYVLKKRIKTTFPVVPNY